MTITFTPVRQIIGNLLATLIECKAKFEFHNNVLKYYIYDVNCIKADTTSDGLSLTISFKALNNNTIYKTNNAIYILISNIVDIKIDE